MSSDEKLYYSIGEVAQMLDVNASLLRFWEKEFPSLRPVKNKKGDRSYTHQDIDLLRRILYLTRDCGFTLDGAREQLKGGSTPNKNIQIADRLTEVRSFLVELKDLL